MKYSIKFFEVAYADNAPGPEFFWMKEWNKTFTLSFQMLVIQGGDKNILVNTGPAEEVLSDMNKVWAKKLGKNCQLKIRTDPVNAIKSLGLVPDDIDYVIITPLKHYALGSIDRFKNANICISKKGWIDYMAPRYWDSPIEDRQWSVPPRLLKYLMFEGWKKIKLLEDEDEVLPGIKTFWSGGHHRSSICIKINTEKGTVIASDTFFTLENVEKNIPIGITENVFECIDCHNRVKKEADIVLPLYDKNNFKRFKDGVIA